MEMINPKRKIKKSRKVLDDMRKRTLKKMSSDDTIQKDNLKTMRKKVTHSTNVPNMTSNRLTLEMQKYGNVVISETIKRNLVLEKFMLNLSQISHKRVATQCNNRTTNEVPNVTQRIICERNSSLLCDYIPSPNNDNSPIALYHSFIQQLPEYLYRRVPWLMNHESYFILRRKIREVFFDFSNFPIDEQSGNATSLFSNHNDSLFDPLEYIRHGTAMASSRTVSFNRISTGSQTSHVNSINTESDADEASSTSSARIVTPSLTHFATLSDTPQCEYFPHKLNQ